MAPTLRTYNPGRDTGWGRRGIAGTPLVRNRPLGHLLVEANLRARSQTGNFLPWKRHDTPLSEMNELQLYQCFGHCSEYRDFSRIRMNDGKQYWWFRAPAGYLDGQEGTDSPPGEDVTDLVLRQRKPAAPKTDSVPEPPSGDRILSVLRDAYQAGRLDDPKVHEVAARIGSALMSGIPLTRALKVHFEGRDARTEIATLATAVPDLMPLTSLV